MPLRIAVLSDIHYHPDAPADESPRAKDMGDILLLRAVHRLNRFIKPDLTLVLGDLLDDGDAPGAPTWCETLAKHLDLLESPRIVLPGNHDGKTEPFFRTFGAPPAQLDASGARFVPFVDPEEPGWNARRLESEFARLAAARAGFHGPLIALQHVPVFPPGETECPYNYVNAATVIDDMRRHGVALAISGHYHRGFTLLREGELSFVAAPALCEYPCGFLEIEIDGTRIRVMRHDLAVPRELQLIDRHVHSQMAYCNENMDFARIRNLAPRLGLADVGLSEHADQLYYGPQLFRESNYIRRGIAAVQPDARRVEEYLNRAREAGFPPEMTGFEVDCDYQGRPVIEPEAAARAGHLIGAIHDLPELLDGARDPERAADEYLAMLERFIASGIDILAHPFRVFRRAKVQAPERLFAPVVEILRRAGVAAEINFHTNYPPPDFVRLCLERGVRLAFGTDSHNLYELGDFRPHLDLLREIGYDADPRDILWNGRPAR